MDTYSAAVACVMSGEVPEAFLAEAFPLEREAVAAGVRSYAGARSSGADRRRCELAYCEARDVALGRTTLRGPFN